MATITINEARLVGVQARGFQKTASQVLLENTRQQQTDRPYTIFLSHASADAEVILGVKGILESIGYTVYIDWIEDPQLDRKNVTADTATVLRERMNLCRSLFFATTENAVSSKWMPWECGYFDGKKQKTAILPITQSPTDSFKGQEYLGLYPYITKAPRDSDKKMCLWVHKEADIYVEFEAWLSGQEPRR